MPIFMDRHDLDQVTAKDVAEAHNEDLKIQDKYNCNALTYWFDEKRGTAFCLIEAPNADCVKRMHDNAHGLVPHQIIEVEPAVVNAFLGRIEDPASDSVIDDSHYSIINEPAFRIIMYICLKDVFLLKSKVGTEQSYRLIGFTRDTIQKSLIRFKGREVQKDRKKLIISFTSAASAVMCALEIQNKLKTQSIKDDNVNVKISLCGGPPVTNNDKLFGETTQLAEKLCEMTSLKQIVISSEVKKAYNNEILDGLSSDVPVQTISPDEENFILRLMKTTENLWNDPKLDVGHFGKQVGMSRSQFYRKLSTITGKSPNDFIKEFRLEKALQMIENQKGNVTQIAFEAGFNSPSYFARCFQKRFGILPSDIRV
jgi:AraC-like DNA-binding protein